MLTRRSPPAWTSLTYGSGRKPAVSFAEPYVGGRFGSGFSWATARPQVKANATARNRRDMTDLLDVSTRWACRPSSTIAGRAAREKRVGVPALAGFQRAALPLGNRL